VDAAFQRARQFLQREDDLASVQEGLALLHRQVELHPHDPRAWFELAQAYDGLGRQEEAIGPYRRTLELGPEGLPEEDRPRLFLQMGSTLRNLGRYRDSRQILQEGLERFPDFTALRAFLALTEHSAGRFSEASRLWASCLYPQDDSLHDYRRALSWYCQHLDSFPAAPSREGLLHHLEIYVSDLSRSLEFWGWLLDRLGYEVFQDWPGGRSFRLGDTYLVFAQASFLEPPYHRKRVGLNHLAFHARSREALDALARDLQARGTALLYGDRFRTAGRPYAIYFEDPDRIKVEIVAPE
jgi:tetratricopeptide (TPR) repeat protein